MYMWVCMCVCVCVCTYIYLFIFYFFFNPYGKKLFTPLAHPGLLRGSYIVF